jgi:hypothetical protein
MDIQVCGLKRGGKGQPERKKEWPVQEKQTCQQVMMELKIFTRTLHH